MGVHTALVSSESSRDVDDFSAVNLALEIEQGAIAATSDAKVKRLSYVETTVCSSDASSEAGKNNSFGESASDSQSTSSRTDSPDSSSPVVARISTESESSTSGRTSLITSGNSSPTISGGSTSKTSLGPPSPILKNLPQIKHKKDDESSSSVLQIDHYDPNVSSSLGIPHLLSVRPTSISATPRNRTHRQTLSTAWHYAKRLQTFPRDIR